MRKSFFEVGKSVDGFNLAADLVKYLEGNTIPTEDPTKRVMTFYRPRGVYAVVTPWNFPVNIPVEYIAPGLAAGNTIVWTPAPTTSLVAVALTRAIEEADLPPGVLNLVTGAGAVVGDEIVSNPGTDAVGFTGSAATGKQISLRAAGKPQLMELGGNGPVVILDDADLDRAAAATASGCFVNAGQVCSSSERILVHRKSPRCVRRAHGGGGARRGARRSAQGRGHHGPAQQCRRGRQGGEPCGRRSGARRQGRHRRQGGGQLPKPALFRADGADRRVARRA